jgi:prefoldin subunit 5
MTDTSVIPPEIRPSLQTLEQQIQALDQHSRALIDSLADVQNLINAILVNMRGKDSDDR